MISIEMTVAEILDLYRNCDVNYKLKERLVAALEKAVAVKGMGNNYTFTFYSLRNPENFINCIKIIRLHTKMHLRDAKEFMDVVRGTLSYDNVYRGGTSKNLTGYSEDICSKIVSDLRDIGEWDINYTPST
jgi:hypothetical protein